MPNQPSLGHQPLLPELLKFLGKFVVCYALALHLWTLLLLGLMTGLTWAAGAVWPPVCVAGVALRVDGRKIVAQTRDFSMRFNQMERIPFTAVTFLALALATSGLRFSRRLGLIALGLLILCGSYVAAMSLTFESYLAQWYLSYMARVGAAGSALSFAYSPAQAQVYGWLLSFWIDMGQHVLPIAVWAGLTLALSRARRGAGRGGCWAERATGAGVPLWPRPNYLLDCCVLRLNTANSGVGVDRTLKTKKTSLQSEPGRKTRWGAARPNNWFVSSALRWNRNGRSKSGHLRWFVGHLMDQRIGRLGFGPLNPSTKGRFASP